MTRLRSFVLGALCIVAFAASGSAHAADKVKAAIDAANRTFLEAYAKGDAATVASVYAADAVVMPPGAPPAKGRAAIQKFWQGAMDSGVTNVSLHTAQVGSSGTLAYEQGEFALDVHGKDGKTKHVVGKYIVVWKRNPQGQWQLYRDIWNESPK